MPGLPVRARAEIRTQACWLVSLFTMPYGSNEQLSHVYFYLKQQNCKWVLFHILLEMKNSFLQVVKCLTKLTRSSSL